MNIFLHELKAVRKSTILWACSLVAVMVLFLSIFPAIAKDVDDFRKVLGSYPEGVRKALGISLDNIASLLGFYSFVFGYILLCSSIQAMNLGTSILSKEIREKTADFLLTKPVTRTRILTAKLAASVTSLILTNVIYLGAASIMASTVKDASFEWDIFLLISLTAFLVQLLFLALGIFISVLVPKIRSVLPISLGTVFAFFVVGMLSSIISDDAVRYITPFKYYDTAYIMEHSAYQGSFILLEIVLLAALGLSSYIIYGKKDIHAV